MSKPFEHKRLEITLPVKKIIEIWEKEGLAAAIDAEVKNKKAQKKKKKSHKDGTPSILDHHFVLLKKKKAVPADNLLELVAGELDLAEAMQEAMIESDFLEVPSASIESPVKDIEDLLNKKSKDGETSGDN